MSNFIHATGTNGFIGSAPVALIASTQLASLGSGNSVLVSTVFSQSSFASAQRGLIALKVITTAWTPTAGGNLAGWWLHSIDGGTTFEAQTANVALPRPPDFIIPFTAAALNVNDIIFAAGIPLLPYDSCKLYIQNNSGVALGAGNHTLNCYPVADTYA